MYQSVLIMCGRASVNEKITRDSTVHSRTVNHAVLRMKARTVQLVGMCESATRQRNLFFLVKKGGKKDFDDVDRY